jgi:hypothetical protein
MRIHAPFPDPGSLPLAAGHREIGCSPNLHRPNDPTEAQALREVLLDACRRALDLDLPTPTVIRLHRSITTLHRALRLTMAEPNRPAAAPADRPAANPLSANPPETPVQDPMRQRTAPTPGAQPGNPPRHSSGPSKNPMHQGIVAPTPPSAPLGNPAQRHPVPPRAQDPMHQETIAPTPPTPPLCNLPHRHPVPSRAQDPTHQEIVAPTPPTPPHGKPAHRHPVSSCAHNPM